jgi:ABC-type transporter Mla MlaB component
MTAKLIKVNDTQLRIEGRLTYEVASLLETQWNSFFSSSNDVLKNKKELTVDLQTVQFSNSVGVAILLSWLRDVEAFNVIVHWKNMPINMKKIIHFSGLTPIFFTSKKDQ